MENGVVNDIKNILSTWKVLGVHEKCRLEARLAIDDFDGGDQPDIDLRIKHDMQIGKTDLKVRIPIGGEDE
jgi:hypothetical protein